MPNMTDVLMDEMVAEGGGFFEEDTGVTFDFVKLLEREGGNIVHTDSGGLTKYGITRAYGLNDSQIRNLTEADAIKLYETKYNLWAPSWQGAGGSQAIGDKMFDMAVNMGRSGSSKVMQSMLTRLGYNTAVDGGWVQGGETDRNYRQAIADLGEDVLLRELINEQKKQYKDIIAGDPGKYGTYAKGWENRANFMSDYFRSP
ncbi:hypothetical protein CL614_06555 [archaeon]|jgi:lysozyme family protein|nr:hypothetical protein [archaeon]